MGMLWSMALVYGAGPSREATYTRQWSQGCLYLATRVMDVHVAGVWLGKEGGGEDGEWANADLTAGD